MIPADVLKKIRRIQIVTSRMVTDTFAGKYHSVFKGRGMEFHEVREYVPGDEIRSIDWNVTARYGHPFVKKFVEERELTVMLCLDMSQSAVFGSREKLKSQVAAEICSVLAFSAIHNNDKVGLIIFTDRIEKFIAPRKGLRHVLRVVREALYYKPQGKGTDIGLALDYLSRLCKRRTITFLISDFFADNFKRKLSIANKRHDMVAITINDPRERVLPDAGIVRLFDAESGEFKTIDTSSSVLRRAYYDETSRSLKERKDVFRSLGIDSIDVNTDESYEKALITFFKKRQSKSH
jgi:uncharacterized protein (DUF58 family)